MSLGVRQRVALRATTVMGAAVQQTTLESKLDRLIELLEQATATTASGPTLRLSDCGDWLTLHQYCAWRGVCERTVRSQIKRGNCFVDPASIEPELRWRRTDCERRMHGASLIEERKRRFKAGRQ